ncbi:MAG: hypothetical protein KAR35_07965, partial [Candidatus Heimdallarchaeota archaeon]|nr:hypothetical protein [Candidatus Heimdallarchaeota archaeon]MCK5049295.1 hypothetical protein [Candidatus Heimdallarchaeota archaeon]
IQVDSGVWNNYIAITITIDSLDVGTYNYTLIVYDAYNHKTTGTVMVTVEEPSFDRITSISFLLSIPSIFVIFIFISIYQKRTNNNANSL